MVWAWMGHGCSDAPTQFEHGRYYGLGMDAPSGGGGHYAMSMRGGGN